MEIQGFNSKKNNYNEGEKVVVTDNSLCGLIPVGSVGTVVIPKDHYHSEYLVCIKFDEKDLNGINGASVSNLPYSVLYADDVSNLN